MRFNQVEYMAAKGVANGTLVLTKDPRSEWVEFYTVHKGGVVIGTYERFGTYYSTFLDNNIDGRLLSAAMFYAYTRAAKLNESSTVNKLIGA